MGKRRKSNPMFEDIVAQNENAQQEVTLSSDVEVGSTYNKLDAKKSAAEQLLESERLTEENKAKLEEYPKLAAENTALESKVSELIDKLNDSYREVEKLRAEVDELKAKLEDMQKQPDPEAAANEEIEKLRAQNDEYLMKIADLSFKLSQVETCAAASAAQPFKTDFPATAASQKTQKYRLSNVKYLHRQVKAQSGYSDWN